MNCWQTVNKGGRSMHGGRRNQCVCWILVEVAFTVGVNSSYSVGPFKVPLKYGSSVRDLLLHPFLSAADGSFGTYRPASAPAQSLLLTAVSPRIRWREHLGSPQLMLSPPVRSSVSCRDSSSRILTVVVRRGPIRILS